MQISGVATWALLRSLHDHDAPRVRNVPAALVMTPLRLFGGATVYVVVPTLVVGVTGAALARWPGCERSRRVRPTSSGRAG